MVSVGRAFRRVPGVARSLAQVDSYAEEWAGANGEVLRSGAGPLWVVLGDSAAQGVGASSRAQGYVERVRALLSAEDGRTWAVLNLSRSGAKTRDVLDEQLPRLAALTGTGAGADAPDGRDPDLPDPIQPELVTAVVGGNDIVHTPLPRWREDIDELCAALPPGAVVATAPKGLRERKARLANEHVRAAAERHGLRVADLWAHTGPPWRGKFADTFHPNDHGYGEWVAALADALGVRGEATRSAAAEPAG